MSHVLMPVICNGEVFFTEFKTEKYGYKDIQELEASEHFEDIHNHETNEALKYHCANCTRDDVTT
jgi:hypothetical protein